MHPAQRPDRGIAGEAGLSRRKVVARRSEFICTLKTGERPAFILPRLDVDHHHARDRSWRKAHQPMTFVSGEAVTKRPPQSRMKPI